MTSVLDPSTIGKPRRPRKHVRTLTGKEHSLFAGAADRHPRFAAFFPERDASGKEKWPRGDEKTWKAGAPGLSDGNARNLAFNAHLAITRNHQFTDVPSITKSIVNHVQTSLSRQAHNIDNLGAYQAAALSVRDNLLVCACIFALQFIFTQLAF
jgi:starch phosphorylase